MNVCSKLIVNEIWRLRLQLGLFLSGWHNLNINVCCSDGSTIRNLNIHQWIRSELLNHSKTKIIVSDWVDLLIIANENE